MDFAMAVNEDMDEVLDRLEQATNITNISREDLAVLLQTRTHWFHERAETLLIVVYTFIMTFGVLGNGIVCFIICRSKKLHNMHNYLIANLSVSDVIMSVFCMPFTLMKLLVKEWHLGAALCRVVPWMQAVGVFASTISITAIALDRYQTIMNPESPLAGEARNKLAFIVIAAIWVISGLVSLPLIIYTKMEYVSILSPLVGYNSCIELDNWPSQSSRIFYACLVMLLQFVAPILVIVVVHWRICNFLKERMLQLPASEKVVGNVTMRHHCLTRGVKEASRHRQNTTLLMAIAVIFALCWFPLGLLNFLADLLFDFKHFLVAFAFTHIIAMISACINPILYGWFNSKFRREFKQIVCCWGSSRKNSDTEERCHLFNDAKKEGKKEVKDTGTSPRQGPLDSPRKLAIVHRHQMCYKSIQTEIQPPSTFKYYGTYNEGASLDMHLVDKITSKKAARQRKRSRCIDRQRPRSHSDQTNLKISHDVTLISPKLCKKHFLQ